MSADDTSSLSSITGIRTVVVPVTDMDRAIAFWTDALGFEVQMDSTFGDDQRWVEVAARDAGSGATTIGLASGGNVTTGVNTGIRLTTDDAATAWAALADLGVDLDDLLAVPGTPPMFTFRDGDGNELVVVEVPSAV
ncbi:VOC family protein [Cellulomonas chengniuliangii]|jgi:catechol 2,3-dioxygenase-like lactoylglutathione lyase family enzyme|uniref:VOC family protein n=1 Tax=Cellulomonas chengniuliangii TaxID=2968084 RepID=UPI001D0E1058|nr:VOC family protein [Cellulomonas chengniuliangii]MCC2318500.1 VOC family protein [Cellulomonas chengniuliangii]